MHKTSQIPHARNFSLTVDEEVGQNAKAHGFQRRGIELDWRPLVSSGVHPQSADNDHFMEHVLARHPA